MVRSTRDLASSVNRVYVNESTVPRPLLIANHLGTNGQRR